MKIKILLFIFIASLAFAQPAQQFALIGDLELTNGDTLYNCKVGFRTFGKLNSDSSNIVIYPTWFGGTSKQIAGLIGHKKGKNGKLKKLVDDSKYFVIAIDALANGVSTSPSNSKIQSGKDFPEISITDMVNSQYKMLTEHFGFHHIYAIIGGSMGSMQALQWVVSYPDFVDKAVPYVATPRVSTYDKLLMTYRIKLITSYRKLGANDKLINTMINYTSQILAHSPEYIVENISHDEFEDFINKKIENGKPSKTFSLDNQLVQLKAMINHNIYKNYKNSVEEGAKQIKAKLFFILGRKDHLLNPAPALKLAKVLNSEVLMLENNYGHLAVGKELSRCGEAIDSFLEKK